MRAAWSILTERTTRPSRFSGRPAAFGSVMSMGSNLAACRVVRAARAAGVRF